MVFSFLLLTMYTLNTLKIDQLRQRKRGTKCCKKCLYQDPPCRKLMFSSTELKCCNITVSKFTSAQNFSAEIRTKHLKPSY